MENNFKYDEYGDLICPFCDFPLKYKDDFVVDYYICTGNCDRYFDFNGYPIKDIDEYFELHGEDYDYDD